MVLRIVIERLVFPALFRDTRIMSTDMRVYMWMYYNVVTTIYAHAQALKVSKETFRRSVHRLLEAGWVYRVEGTGRQRGLFVPWMPPQLERLVASELTRLRGDAKHVGEWLMRCRLDLMVDDLDYHDDARPTWLVSGDGSGRLELDRFYRTAGVAFEFQGSQHFHVGGSYAPNAEALGDQIVRDNIKAGVCARRNIRFIEVTASELSHERMMNKIDGLLPTNFVKKDSPIFTTLDDMCRNYANYVARQEKRGREG